MNLDKKLDLPAPLADQKLDTSEAEVGLGEPSLVVEKVDRPETEQFLQLVEEFLETQRAAFSGEFTSWEEAKQVEAEAIERFFGPFKRGEMQVSEYLSNPQTSGQMAEALRMIYMTEFDSMTTRVNTKLHYNQVLDDVCKVLPSLASQLRQNSPGEIKQNDPDDKKLVDQLRFRANIMYVVSESIDHVSNNNRANTNQWLKNNFDLLFSASRPYKLNEDTTDYISQYTLKNIIARSNDQPLINKCLRLAEDENLDLFDNPKSLAKDLLDESQYQTYIMNRMILARHLVEQAGLDHQTAHLLVEKWQQSRKFIKNDENGLEITQESYLENLRVLQELETAKPGAAQELFNKFGIANFARYPVATLLNQLEKAEQGLPYGVVAFPEADYNGAFMQMSKLMGKLQQDLQTGGQETRFIEVASQFELARRLASMHQQYSSSGNKIDFLVIGGHGQPESIQLGGPVSSPPPIPNPELSPAEVQQVIVSWLERTQQGKRMRQELKISDLEQGGGAGVRRAVSKWFDADAQVVFISCSTGAEGGFAQRVSDELGFSTIAPNIPAYVKEIGVNFNERGKPKFEVEFGASDDRKPETKKYIPASKQE